MPQNGICVCPPAPWFISNNDKSGYDYSMVINSERNDRFLRITALYDNHYFSSGYITRKLEVSPNTSYKVFAFIKKLGGQARLAIIHENSKSEAISKISWSNNPFVPEFVPLELVRGHLINQPFIIELTFKTAPGEQNVKLSVGLVSSKGFIEIEKISVVEAKTAGKGGLKK